MSAMPGMAEEVGANTAVVSIIQTMRVFLVVLAVPLFVVYWGSNTGRHAVSVTPSVFEWGSLLWTGVLIVTAVVGYYIGKLKISCSLVSRRNAYCCNCSNSCLIVRGV